MAGTGRRVPRRRLLAGGAGAATLGITATVLPRAAAAASGVGTSDASFVQTSSTLSSTGDDGFSAYSLSGITAVGSTLYVASYDQPGVVGTVAATDLTVTGSVTLSFDDSTVIATDGTHLYVSPGSVDTDGDMVVAKIAADDLSVVGTPLALPGFESVGALVVAGSELLVVGTLFEDEAGATAGRITKVTTADMSIYGSLDLADRDLVDADLVSPHLYAVSWTGHLDRVLLTGGSVDDGGMIASATLDLDGDDATYAITILDGHAYIADAGYGTVQVRKVELPGGTGAMSIVGRLTLPDDEDFRTATNDGSSVFFGGYSATAPGLTARVIKVRPTGGTAEGAGGMVRVGAVDPTDPDGFALQEVADLLHLGGSIYAVGGAAIVKLAAGT